MEPPQFALTPAQKGMLASLLNETGQPAPTLAAAITAALEELQDQEPQDGTNGHDATQATAVPSSTFRKPIWEQFAEAFQDVPKEELEALPVDGAAQHDHYIYGWPKRPL